MPRPCVVTRTHAYFAFRQKKNPLRVAMRKTFFFYTNYNSALIFFFNCRAIFSLRKVWPQKIASFDGCDVNTNFLRLTNVVKVITQKKQNKKNQT